MSPSDYPDLSAVDETCTEERTRVDDEVTCKQTCSRAFEISAAVHADADIAAATIQCHPDTSGGWYCSCRRRDGMIEQHPGVAAASGEAACDAIAPSCYGE